MSRIRDIAERIAADPETEVISLVNQIANLQAAEVVMTDEAAKELMKKWSERARAEESLRRVLKSNPEAVKNVIVDLLRSNRVSTGDLGSRLVDDIERISGESVYPPTWKVRKSRWSITEEHGA